MSTERETRMQRLTDARKSRTLRDITAMTSVGGDAVEERSGLNEATFATRRFDNAIRRKVDRLLPSARLQARA